MLPSSSVERRLASLRQRGFYFQGKHYACGDGPGNFSLEANETKGAESVSLSARELFLFSPALFGSPPELAFRTVATSDYSRNLGGTFQVDSFGNCVWGTPIRRGPFFSLDLHEAVFHRPHFLPKLWRTLMMKYRVLSVRAVLPDSSPMAALFPRVRERGEAWLRWPSNLKGEGVHFILPPAKGYYEPD